jgi:hypothetical protein
MRISKGEYFIGKDSDSKKTYLAKALEDSHGKSVEAVSEKNSHIPGMRHTFTQDLSTVILNLGDKPFPGKVHGHDVSTLFTKRLTHDVFGDVFFFYRPDKQVLTDLKESMNKVAERLKRQGLSFLLDGVIFEVLPYNGEKYAGMYMKSKNEKIPNRMQIRPEIMPASEYAYVWYHEIGHHLHLSFCTGSKKLNASWLKLFNTSIRVETIKKDKSQQLLDALIGGEECPSDFKRGLDEEDALAFKWLIRTISQVNGLSIQDLDTLFEADMKDEITKVWPVRNIPRKELAPIVSEYATVNFKELFAECFAFYMTKKKLPEPIVKLMERSISYAKANRDKSSDE